MMTPLDARPRAIVGEALVAEGYPAFSEHDDDAFGAIRLGDHLGMTWEDGLRVLRRIARACGGYSTEMQRKRVRTLGDLVREAQVLLRRSRARLLDRARALPTDARMKVVIGAGAPGRAGEAWAVPGLGKVVVVSHLEDGRTVVDARAGDVALALEGGGS